MFKRLSVATLVLIMIASVLMITMQPISAHTVSTVTPYANQTTRNILQKIANLPERTNGVNRTITGQFMGYSSFDWQYSSLMNSLGTTVKQYPMLAGEDIANGGDASKTFLGAFNYAANSDMKTHWNNGGLITVSHHFPNPLRTNGMAGLSATGRETTSNISAMLNGSNYNTNADCKRWFDALWKVYSAIKDLKNSGVTVIYRPLHEMNGDWFWWGGLGTSVRPNSSVNDYKMLWNSIFTYMTTSHGTGNPALDNIIWVYAPDYSRDNYTSYFPGSTKVDIVGLDAYLDDPDTNARLNTVYLGMLGLGKTFAFTEIGPRNNRTDGTFDYRKWLNAIKNRFGQTTYCLAWNNFNNNGQLVKIFPPSNYYSWNLYNDYNWMLNRGEESIR